jgi:hypothetical protein
MVDVSIVIVSWNTRQLLLDCIESIRAAPDRATREIVVVDNASGDGTPAALREAYPEVRLIEARTNLGFAAANNLGMRSARGKWVFLVNSDVIVLPGALDAMAEYMDSHPRVAVAGPRVLNGDRTLQISCRNLPTPKRLLWRVLALDRICARRGWFEGEELFHWPHDEEAEVEAVSGCFMALRPAAMAEVGLFDERYFIYAEDIDWCLRFRKAGWGVRFTPSARIVHLGGASSAHAPARFSVEQERALLTFWRKHYGRPGRLYYAGMRITQVALRLIPRVVVYVFRPSRRPDLRSKIHCYLSCMRWLSMSGEPWRTYSE